MRIITNRKRRQQSEDFKVDFPKTEIQEKLRFYLILFSLMFGAII